MASSIWSAAAAGVERSGTSSQARARRTWASPWRPCQCSTAAHRVVSSTRRTTESGGSSSSASSSVPRQRSSSPTERSAEASPTRTDTCRSVSPLGSSRRAASNQRAAACGARAAAERPASSRSSIAASSPCPAALSTW